MIENTEQKEQQKSTHTKRKKRKKRKKKKVLYMPCVNSTVSYTTYVICKRKITYLLTKAFILSSPENSSVQFTPSFPTSQLHYLHSEQT